MSNPAAGQARAAVAAGLAAGIVWGFVPIIFQAVARAGPGAGEDLTERIVWGGAAAAVFVTVAKQWPQVRRVFGDRKTLSWLALSAVLIAINWVVFIWAVNHGKVLESALGYYITPLVSMAAGALIFGERLGKVGLTAIALAAIGVVIQAFALGALPIVALTLAATFGSYGIVRKHVAADAQSGLFIECLILSPLSLAFIAWQAHAGQAFFFQSPAAATWLVLAGFITAAPLALFAWGARRMPLSAMGFIQFLSPTISFVIGVIEGEPFTPLRALSFAFIWLGAGVFVFGAVQAARRVRTPSAA